MIRHLFFKILIFEPPLPHTDDEDRFDRLSFIHSTRLSNADKIPIKLRKKLDLNSLLGKWQRQLIILKEIDIVANEEI
jgi:hypothetical protein